MISRTAAIWRYRRLGLDLAAGRADAYTRAMVRGTRKPKKRRRVQRVQHANL
jgi:hypothetical protein